MSGPITTITAAKSISFHAGPATSQSDLDLIQAAKDGELDTVVSLLTEKKANPLTWDPKTQVTALNAVARHGLSELFREEQKDDAKIAEALLAAGAEVNKKDGRGLTPLGNAALTGRPKMVEIFLHHDADPLLRDNSGHTPCSHALWVLKGLRGAKADEESACYNTIIDLLTTAAYKQSKAHNPSTAELFREQMEEEH